MGRIRGWIGLGDNWPSKKKEIPGSIAVATLGWLPVKVRIKKKKREKKKSRRGVGLGEGERWGGVWVCGGWRNPSESEIVTAHSRRFARPNSGGGSSLLLLFFFLLLSSWVFLAASAKIVKFMCRLVDYPGAGSLWAPGDSGSHYARQEISPRGLPSRPPQPLHSLPTTRLSHLIINTKKMEFPIQCLYVL